MPPLCPKPVRELMRDMVLDLDLQPGQILRRDQVVEPCRVSPRGL